MVVELLTLACICTIIQKIMDSMNAVCRPLPHRSDYDYSYQRLIARVYTASNPRAQTDRSHPLASSEIQLSLHSIAVWTPRRQLIIALRRINYLRPGERRSVNGGERGRDLLYRKFFFSRFGGGGATYFFPWGEMAAGQL